MCRMSLGRPRLNVSAFSVAVVAVSAQRIVIPLSYAMCSCTPRVLGSAFDIVFVSFSLYTPPGARCLKAFWMFC